MTGDADNRPDFDLLRAAIPAHMPAAHESRVADASALFWLDIETTGADPHDDDIVEVAAVVTTVGLDRVLNTYQRVISRPSSRLRPSGYALTADEWGHVLKVPGDDPEVVYRMHARSGLLHELIEDRGVTGEEVADALADMAADSGDALLAGSSVHFDREFINTQWGRGVLAGLHHRNLDVSTLRTFIRSYRPDLEPWPKTDAHRAMADVQDAIAELRHYREVLAAARPTKE